MPEVTRPDGAILHYEVAGDGFPVLAIAPGGVSSEIERWAGYLMDPMTALQDRFMVIGMDQRFAGRSVAPMSPFSYEETLGDQLAVLDALGVQRAHVIGADFGAAQALRLAYQAPARTASVVLIEPVGLDGSNLIGDYYARFNHTIRLARAEGLDAVLEASLNSPRFEDNQAAGPWASRLHRDAGFREALRRLGRETYITLVVDFRDGMVPWGRRFFSVSDQAPGRTRRPVLIAPGQDRQHPRGLGRVLCDEVVGAILADGNGTALSQLVLEFLDTQSDNSFSVSV